MDLAYWVTGKPLRALLVPSTATSGHHMVLGYCHFRMSARLSQEMTWAREESGQRVGHGCDQST